MNLRTFTGRSMPEALAAVRRELGANAVILHTRTYKRGGLLGLGARTVVEITAGDGQEVGRARRRAQAAARPAPRRAAATPAARLDTAHHASAHGPTGDLIRRTYAAARAEFERTAPPLPADNPQPAPITAAPAAPAAVTAAPPDPGQLAQEMRAVKLMLQRMARQGGPPAAPGGGDDQLFAQYLALLEQEVADELAEEIIDRVRRELSPEQLGCEKTCRRAVRRALCEAVPTRSDPDGLAPPPGGGPRVIALVGPTGVGKTTTVAKLAATFKLKQGKRVGLVTMDTYRIAAVEQLRTYAGIIGVPLRVVTTPGDLAEAVRGFAEYDAVLIDTAGRSQRNGDRLEELKRFLEAGKPHDVHLVLSSTCSQKVLLETAERFSAVRSDSIIFTKLDEAVTFGVVLNVARKVRKQLSYITTGQEVPHQIEPGRADRLASLVLGQEGLGP